MSDFDLVKANAYVVAKTSPNSEVGVSDPARLQAFVKDLADSNLSLREEAAKLFVGLYKGDLFMSMNKRMSWVVTAVFYRMNGFFIDFKDDDIIDLMSLIDNTDKSDEELIEITESFLDNKEFIINEQ